MVRETRDRTLFANMLAMPALPFATAGGEAIGEHDGVSGPGARSRDTLELEGLFFKQAVEHTPGESAVAAAALECEVQEFSYPLPGVLPFGLICLIEESHRALPLLSSFPQPSEAFLSKCGVPVDPREAVDDWD